MDEGNNLTHDAKEFLSVLYWTISTRCTVRCTSTKRHPPQAYVTGLQHALGTSRWGNPSICYDCRKSTAIQLLTGAGSEHLLNMLNMRSTKKPWFMQFPLEAFCNGVETRVAGPRPWQEFALGWERLSFQQLCSCSAAKWWANELALWRWVACVNLFGMTVSLPWKHDMLPVRWNLSSKNSDRFWNHSTQRNSSSSRPRTGLAAITGRVLISGRAGTQVISFARDTSSTPVQNSGNGRMVDFRTSFFSSTSREHGGFGGLCPGKCCRTRIVVYYKL